MYQASEKRYQQMSYTNCGKSGLKLPAVSFGLWHNFGSNAAYDTMKELCFAAFDLGITHFDLANNYGPVPGSAEENFGRILKRELSPYRDEMIISTKAGYDMWDGPYGSGGSRKYLVASLDQSLKRMGLDYVDIFYHHCMDPDTPLDESMGALVSIVKSGKALYVVINQNRYSIFDRSIEENGLKEAAKSLGKGIIAYSPLAQGMLTDRYLNGIPADSRIRTDGRFLNENALTKERMAKIRGLQDVAEKRGQTLSQMALNWVLKDHEVTSVLVGASCPSQLVENATKISRTPFTDEELARIDAISLD